MAGAGRSYKGVSSPPWDGIIVKERKSNGASSSERTAMGWEIVRLILTEFIFPSTELVSDFNSGFFSFFSIWFSSRPKKVKDVAHQEEVVRVLTNTLETANVIRQNTLGYNSNDYIWFQLQVWKP